MRLFHREARACKTGLCDDDSIETAGLDRHWNVLQHPGANTVAPAFRLPAR
jgi:hypothetical protein